MNLTSKSLNTSQNINQNQTSVTNLKQKQFDVNIFDNNIMTKVEPPNYNSLHRNNQIQTKNLQTNMTSNIFQSQNNQQFNQTINQTNNQINTNIIPIKLLNDNQSYLRSASQNIFNNNQNNYDIDNNNINYSKNQVIRNVEYQRYLDYKKIKNLQFSEEILKLVQTSIEQQIIPITLVNESHKAKLQNFQLQPANRNSQQFPNNFKMQNSNLNPIQNLNNNTDQNNLNQNQLNYKQNQTSFLINQTKIINQNLSTNNQTQNPLFQNQNIQMNNVNQNPPINNQIMSTNNVIQQQQQINQSQNNFINNSNINQNNINQNQNISNQNYYNQNKIEQQNINQNNMKQNQNITNQNKMILNQNNQNLYQNNMNQNIQNINQNQNIMHQNLINPNMNTEKNNQNNVTQNYSNYTNQNNLNYNDHDRFNNMNTNTQNLNQNNFNQTNPLHSNINQVIQNDLNQKTSNFVIPNSQNNMNQISINNFNQDPSFKDQNQDFHKNIHQFCQLNQKEQNSLKIEQNSTIANDLSNMNQIPLQNFQSQNLNKNNTIRDDNLNKNTNTNDLNLMNQQNSFIQPNDMNLLNNQDVANKMIQNLQVPQINTNIQDQNMFQNIKAEFEPIRNIQPSPCIETTNKDLFDYSLFINHPKSPEILYNLNKKFITYAKSQKISTSNQMEIPRIKIIKPNNNLIQNMPEKQLNQLTNNQIQNNDQKEVKQRKNIDFTTQNDFSKLIDIQIEIRDGSTSDKITLKNAKIIQNCKIIALKRYILRKFLNNAKGQHSIYYEENELDDESTLSDHGIENNSHLTFEYNLIIQNQLRNKFLQKLQCISDNLCQVMKNNFNYLIDISNQTIKSQLFNSVKHHENYQSTIQPCYSLISFTDNSKIPVEEIIKIKNIFENKEN